VRATSKWWYGIQGEKLRSDLSRELERAWRAKSDLLRQYGGGAPFVLILRKRIAGYAIESEIVIA
jgi:hypothetical protein